MHTITLITTLKLGVSAGEYEAWAKMRDQAFMDGLDCVKDFSIRRIEGEVSGAPGASWMYIEQFTVLDPDRYSEALESDAGEKLRRELFELIDREKTVRFISKAI